MKKYIRAEIQHMALSEALKIIPQDTLERIKRADEHPNISIFVIANEGVANAQELSFGSKIKKAYKYVKDMIIKVNEKLQMGTPIFNRHGNDNSYYGRQQIGEVVGKTVKYIGDKLSALAAVYIYPEFRDLPLNVASFEANVEYIPKSEGVAEVIDIDNISAIALSHSSIDEPAFKEATLLGVVQAFIQPETKEKLDLTDPKNNDFIPRENSGLSKEDLANFLIPSEFKGDSVERKLQEGGDTIEISEEFKLVKMADDSYALMSSNGSQISGIEIEDLRALESFFKGKSE